MIEENVILSLSSYFGSYDNSILNIHGGYIKIVGTSFRDKITLTTGQVTLKEFFGKVGTTPSFFGDLEEIFRKIKSGNVDIEWIENFQKKINEFVKIEREPNNPYDPNAIVVYVNYVNRFIKVGYLSKDLAEFIVTQKLKCYIVGFKKSGRGMILTMIFTFPEIQVVESLVPPVHNENRNLGFMSLNKMRRRLCK